MQKDQRKTKSELLNLKLHEEMKDHHANYKIVRVIGGWIYTNAIGNPVFVPLTTHI